MNVFICGQKSFGNAVLELCVNRGYNVVGVSAPYMDKMYSSALRRGVGLVIEAGKLNHENMPDGVDIILAAHSHDFIGSKTRGKASLGAIGYHPSLLPVHRGRDAIRWAIAMGDRITGGSIYWLSENIDGGDIFAQSVVFIRPGETASELWRRALFKTGIDLFGSVLSDIENGIIRRTPQDNSCATWEPSITRQPVFRPDLPRIGGIPGYSVVPGKCVNY